MARRESRGRGTLEREVIMCLAAAKRPLTAADVQAEIGGLAYTTVMTTLSRLHSKGALQRELQGRAYEYSLIGGTKGAQSNMTAHQMLKLLDDEADRAGVLTRFVAELKPADERLLSELLERSANPHFIDAAAITDAAEDREMIWVAVTPFVVSLVLARYADAIAHHLRPSTAVRLLTGLSLSVALCTGLVLSVAAVLVCVQLGPFPSLGRWSVQALRKHTGFPVAVGIVALVVVTYCLIAAMVRAAGSVRALHRASQSARELEPSIGDLVVIDDDVPVAYSVAGLGGRIVVSTSMLAALSPGERRVLLAHEASHLRHRHHLYLHLAELAAAANPLLRSTTDSIRRAIERWADDDAALCVGDRVLAGRAVARAALATGGSAAGPRLRHAMSIADDAVADRVQLLLADPARRRLWPAVLVVVAGAASWTAAAAFAAWGNGLVQFAESVYPRH